MDGKYNILMKSEIDKNTLYIDVYSIAKALHWGYESEKEIIYIGKRQKAKVIYFKKEPW
jgi:hypothetical protein